MSRRLGIRSKGRYIRRLLMHSISKSLIFITQFAANPTIYGSTKLYTACMAETTILERPVVVRRGRRLEYFTIAWNTLEGLVAVIAGAVAGSVSLVGFGIDSFIEVTSGSALLWRMSVDADEHRRERNERRALQIVRAWFLCLAAYITYESAADLWSNPAPEHSSPR